MALFYASYHYGRLYKKITVEKREENRKEKKSGEKLRNIVSPFLSDLSEPWNIVNIFFIIFFCIRYCVADDRLDCKQQQQKHFQKNLSCYDSVRWNGLLEFQGERLTWDRISNVMEINQISFSLGNPLETAEKNKGLHEVRSLYLAIHSLQQQQQQQWQQRSPDKHRLL